MMLLEEALALLLEHAPVPAAERLPLAGCFGRVLAEEIISDIEFPPFNRSPLDGYAVKLADIFPATPENPVLLQQVDNVPAGTVSRKIIESGQAARIMTGAPIPAGADAVVRLEDTHIAGQKIAVRTAELAAKNICSRGEEIQLREKVLTRGTYLNEGGLGLLAMLGQTAPLVYQKPAVGILSTGSELISPAESLVPGKIRDSNSYMLLAKVLQSGGQPCPLGIVTDDLPSILAKLHKQPHLPIYITTGGASVGDYDLMEQLFKELRVPLLFKRVAIKPGMPVLAGVWNQSLIIALSGNPAACSISFEMLVRPLLRKIAGLSTWEHTRCTVTLCTAFQKSSPSRRFVWARWFSKEGRIFAEPLQHQGNGMLKSALQANALLDIPAGSPAPEAGASLNAILF